MSKPKLSLCLIVKPTDDEAKLLNRCLGTVYNYVDEICLTITGENKKCEEIGKKYHAKISHFEWIDDFSAARNYNFKQASGDYIFWIDTDDLVEGADKLPSVVKEMDKEAIDAGIMDYLYDFDQYGKCTVKHRKTRIVRNDGCVRWTGKLHEDFKEERKINGYFIKDIKIIHKTNDKRIRNAQKRNLKIALSNLKKNPNDPRSYWLAANAYSAVGEPERAIEMLLRFIPISSSESEKCLAWHRLAGSYLSLGETGRAIEADLESQRMRPWYPDPYLGLGEIFFNMGKYKHAKEYLIQGLSKKPAEDEYIVWNPRDYDFNPLMLLGKCYLELAKPREARKCFRHCLKIYPKHPQVTEILDALDREIEKIDKVDDICEKVKKAKTKKEIKELIDSAPVEMRSHPKLCHLRNVHFIKKKSSGKDLVIYCFWTKERFNPEIVEKIGRGGSEEAVCHMSKRLADLGWNVTVYANCGHEAKKFGKVMWKPFWEYNIRDKEDVLIIWRHPMMFDFKEVNATKKYVWLHDVLKPKEFTPQRLNKIDKIFALSKWQRNLFPEVDEKKFLITGNGIEPKEVDIKRDQHRIIYTSSYDRGLKTLLKLFPYIRKEDPKAELHIFYGWHVWDAMWQGDVKMAKEKEEILELMEQPGVFEHGRVSQEQIIEEYSKANIWAYPTEFGEISCFPQGTRIMTDKGEKEIEKMNVIDNVITHKGNIKPVAKVMRRKYQGEMYKFKVQSGDDITCTPEHPIFVLREGKKQFIEAKDVRTNDKLLVPRLKENKDKVEIDISEDRRKSYFPNKKINIPDKIKVDNDLMWWFGYFAGDGSASSKTSKISCLVANTHKDRDLEKVRKGFKKLGLEPKEKELQGCLEVYAHSHKLARWIRKNFYINKNKVIPRKLWNKKPVFDGLMAADGSCYNGYNYSFTNKSLYLIGYVKSLLAQQGFYGKTKKREHKNGCISYSITWTQERKMEFYKVEDDYVQLKIKEINTEKFDDYVYNLEVEDDNSYLANGNAVHNCISAMKAQAYGAYPITTTMAALDETVQRGVKVDSKQIYTDEKAQQEFLDAVIDKIKNPPSEKERKEMMDWAKEYFNWDKVAKKWNEEFKK